MAILKDRLKEKIWRQREQRKRDRKLMGYDWKEQYDKTFDKEKNKNKTLKNWS